MTDSLETNHFFRSLEESNRTTNRNDYDDLGFVKLLKGFAIQEQTETK